MLPSGARKWTQALPLSSSPDSKRISTPADRSSAVAVRMSSTRNPATGPVVKWRLIALSGPKASTLLPSGPPDALQLKDIDTPVVTADAVLVRVHAAAVGEGRLADGPSSAVRGPHAVRAAQPKARCSWFRRGRACRGHRPQRDPAAT